MGLSERLLVVLLVYLVVSEDILFLFSQLPCGLVEHLLFLGASFILLPDTDKQCVLLFTCPSELILKFLKLSYQRDIL